MYKRQGVPRGVASSLTPRAASTTCSDLIVSSLLTSVFTRRVVEPLISPLLPERSNGRGALAEPFSGAWFGANNSGIAHDAASGRCFAGETEA